jgi:hypothetical protein
MTGRILEPLTGSDKDFLVLYRSLRHATRLQNRFSKKTARQSR